jgi:hypothetical protein
MCSSIACQESDRMSRDRMSRDRMSRDRMSGMRDLQSLIVRVDVSDDA